MKKEKQKNKKMYWVFLIVIFVIIIILNNLFKNSYVDISILDSKFCERDEDCVITSRKKLDCCSICFIEPISKEAELEREKWEKLNCNNEDYKYCLYAECSIVPRDFIAVCINNKCDMIERIKE